jgi:hypothetical protein
MDMAMQHGHTVGMQHRPGKLQKNFAKAVTRFLSLLNIFALHFNFFILVRNIL